MRLKKCFQTLAISCMAFLPLNAFASDELITGRGLPETYKPAYPPVMAKIIYDFRECYNERSRLHRLLSEQGVSCMAFLPLNAFASDELITGRGLPETYTEVTAQKTTSGSTLIFSDSPEMVYRNGVLYRDTVSGDVRIFFHHVNAMETNKKLAVILSNEQMRPVKYSVANNSIGNAGWHYLKVGKETQQKYFSGVHNKSEGNLGFGNNTELLTGRGYVLEPAQLLVGTIDLHTDRPVQVSVIMCDEKTDLDLYNEYAPVQPMDEHPLRGTFDDADWNYTVSAPLNTDNNKVYMLELASEEQGFARGKDGTTGKDAVNYGNYGIVYSVNFTISGNKPSAMYLNPLGGLFAGYGVLKKAGEEKILPLPQDKVAIGDSYDDLLKLGVLEPGTYSFIWSPPGASNLPVRLYWMQDGSL